MKMKLFKNITRTISAIFRKIYKIIDKFIIIPITKFILFITDKMGKRTNRFEKWLTRKDTLVVISLLLAICLFLYIDNESTIIIDDSAEVLYGQKVEVTYNSNAYVIEGLPETVDVTLIGRKVDLYLAKQLSSGSVTADLSDLKVGTHTITLNYDSPITSVDYKLDPSVININVYPKISETRTASVDVINKSKLDTKLSIGDVKLSQTEIVIKGSEHSLADVAIVKALVDVNKIVDPEIGVVNLDDVKLVAYDGDGFVVENIEMEPSKVSATVTIESTKKEVPIKIIPTGSVEFGKAIDTITTDISKVNIYGDQDLLDTIDYVPVEVDVSDLSQNKEYNVIITKPSGIKEISETNIKVKITLDTEVTKEFTDITIATTNLDSNYKASAIGENSSKTSVIVKGTQNVIDTIEASSITAQVDLSGYSEGEYEVAVTVTGEDNKATYTPKTTKIKVKISKKDS